VLLNAAAVLDDLGHAVLEASSGHQALQILRRIAKVNLVIVDQMMPNMTGLELIAAIRAEWPDMPVALATGYGELPADADPGLVKVSKPYQQAALARLVARHGRPSTSGETVLRFRPASATGHRDAAPEAGSPGKEAARVSGTE
jgi:CheY-like chemotaxis protein